MENLLILSHLCPLVFHIVYGEFVDDTNISQIDLEEDGTHITTSI